MAISREPEPCGTGTRPPPVAPPGPVPCRLAIQFRPQRLLWGSDFPHVLLSCGFGRAMELPILVSNEMTGADRAANMGSNAAQLYW